LCDENHERMSIEWADMLRSESRLSSVSWFMLQPGGWRCTDLLYSDWTKKPVYKEWMP